MAAPPSGRAAGVVPGVVPRCWPPPAPARSASSTATGARSVLRRYSDAWFATAKRRKDGDASARYPRRRRGLVPGPLVRRDVRPGRAVPAGPGGAGLPAAAGPPGPRRPLSGGAAAVGDARLRRGQAVRGRDRRGARRGLPAGAGPGPGAGGRGGPGDHPPVRGGGAGRGGAAGVGAGGPGGVPAAPARPQGPLPRRREARTEAGAARVTPLAQAPSRRTESRGPAPAQGAAGPARGRPRGHRLGGAAPGRDPDRRGPARRPGPEGGAAAQPAGPGVAGRAPDVRAAGQGRGRRDHGARG